MTPLTLPGSLYGIQNTKVPYFHFEEQEVNSSGVYRGYKVWWH